MRHRGADGVVGIGFARFRRMAAERKRMKEDGWQVMV